MPSPLRAVFAISSPPLRPGEVVLGCVEALHPHRDRETDEHDRLMAEWLIEEAEPVPFGPPPKPCFTPETRAMLAERDAGRLDELLRQHLPGTLAAPFTSDELSEFDIPDHRDWLTLDDGAPGVIVAKKRRHPGGPRSRGRISKRRR